MAYSLDFRKRVFLLKEKYGLTFKETSERFGVDIRTLFRWQRRLEPKIARKKSATKINMQALQEDVEKNPDRFQYERAQDYGVSQAAIFYALKRLKISRKKTLNHPKADESKRTDFKARLSNYQKVNTPIIYVDESGFALDAPRTHGYTQKGQRCYGTRDWHAKGRVNAIGAILDFEFLSVELWECNIDSVTISVYSRACREIRRRK